MNRLLSKCFHRNKLFRLSHNKKCFFKNNQIINNEYRYQAVPIIPIIQYGFRTSLMIGGRLINRWWRKLSESEKSKIIQKIKNHSKLIATISLTVAGFFGVEYYRNLEYSDISGRWRFMAIGAEDLNSILGDDLSELLVTDQVLLPSEHRQYKDVKGIFDTIISKNKNLYPTLDREWKLIIVEDNDVVNAACLPTGYVIVFTGLINFVENSHQLAAVLSHEISHVLLEHSRETISRTAIVSVMLTFVGFVLWTVVPGDVTALVSNWLKNRIVQICVNLPHNRMLESEADVLGLELMARACLKVGEAQRFWELMDAFEKKNQTQMPNWLCTHPLSLLRAQLLESRMSAAQRLSADCGCFVTSWALSDILVRSV